MDQDGAKTQKSTASKEIRRLLEEALRLSEAAGLALVSANISGTIDHLA